MLILAAAAFGVIRTGSGFAGRAGLENFDDLGPGMAWLPFRDANADPVTLSREGNKNDKALGQACESIAAKNDFFDRDLDRIPARRSGDGIC